MNESQLKFGVYTALFHGSVLVIFPVVFSLPVEGFYMLLVKGNNDVAMRRRTIVTKNIFQEYWREISLCLLINSFPAIQDNCPLLTHLLIFALGSHNCKQYESR